MKAAGESEALHAAGVKTMLKFPLSHSHSTEIYL